VELFFLLFPIRRLTYNEMREMLHDDESTAMSDDTVLRQQWERQGFNPDMMLNSRGEDILSPMIFTAMDFIDDGEIEENPYFTHEQKKQIFHLRRVVRELYDANRDTILRAVESMSRAIVVRYTAYDKDDNERRVVRIYAPLSEDQIRNVIRVLTCVLFKFPTRAV
jgi:hypothetical protein